MTSGPLFHVDELHMYCKYGFVLFRYLDEVALHHLIDALCKLSSESMELAYTNRVSLSVCQTVCLFVSPSVYVSVCLPVSVSDCLSVCASMSVCLCVNQSDCMFVCQSGFGKTPVQTLKRKTPVQTLKRYLSPKMNE